MNQPAAAPAAPPAAPTKPDGREELLRELVTAMKGSMTAQETLIKSYTHALMENTKALHAIRLAITGLDPSVEDPEGQDGLMDVIDELRDSNEELDTRMTGMNMILARYSWVFDRMLDIKTGDPTAPALEFGKEPEAGKVGREPRLPTFQDMVGALKEFDEMAEKEAVAEAEEQERLKKEEEARAASASSPPKPSMMSNAPKRPPPPTAPLRALPPLPVMAAKPGEPSKS